MSALRQDADMLTGSWAVYFPQALMGPTCRTKEALHQLRHGGKK